MQSDPPPDIEGGATAILDQVGRGCHSEEDEGQTLEFQIIGAGVVDSSNGGEEVVSVVELKGGICSFYVAEKLVEEWVADYILMNRPCIREPGLILGWSADDLSEATS